VREDKKLTVVFYRSRAGAEPVRNWLKELPVEDRQALGRDLRLMEMDWPMGMPLCRPLGGGLWEVRSSLMSNRIARVIFCAGHRPHDPAAWFHQKDTEDAAVGF
jgi:hypothetical protein